MAHSDWRCWINIRERRAADNWTLGLRFAFPCRFQLPCSANVGAGHRTSGLCHLVMSCRAHPERSDGINRERRAGSGSRQSPAAGDGPIEGDGRIKEVSDLGPPARARRQPLWRMAMRDCHPRSRLPNTLVNQELMCPGGEACLQHALLDAAAVTRLSAATGFQGTRPRGRGGDLIATYCQMHGCVSAKTAIKLNRRSRIAPTPGSRSGAVPPRTQ
jgi:hypothetical protein